jgi:type VI secretion system protein ImpH
MAGQDRGPSSHLKSDLLGKAHQFSFFQVMRLLRLFLQGLGGPEEKRSAEEEYLRIRPELSLAFPPADVAKIEEIGGEKPLFSITATLLGLYGSSSPLPTFYTEDLFDEAAEDLSVTRDFIDIFNHRLYLLLFRCWTKYRLFLQVIEENNPEVLGKLFCLIGLGEKELRKDLPEAYSLIRYTGLFTQFPKSASGLQTLLHDALGKIPVRVIPCVKRVVKIPPDQRLFLGKSGSRLGEETFLGEEIDDRMGKFRIRLGPLKSNPFHSLLPGSSDHQRLAFLTRFYLLDVLEYDIELILAEKEAKPVSLGEPEWSRLGLDTWVFSLDHLGEVNATFPPQGAA